MADLLFINVHLLTMEGGGVGYIKNGAIALEHGRISAVGTTAELSETISALETIDGQNKLCVMPGLIDAHMHTPYAVVRGVAQDIWNWMQAGLAPYAKHMDPQASLAGTRINLVEGIKAGTTLFGDYSFPIDGWADQFASFGVRAMLTARINAFPKGGMAGWKIGDVYPLDDAVGQEGIDTANAFADNWHRAHDGRINVMYGPQGPDMIGLDQLMECKKLAEQRGLMVHVHTAQGDREIDQMLKRFGERTPAYLQEIGYLDEQLLAVHLTEATDEEAEMIAKSGAKMALCSGSIGIIDGIVPPAHVFRQAGGLVCLGSDQASGNNCNNVWNEMKLTSLFNKIKYGDPTVMPAWEVLRMGTIEGAQAIGLGDEIGSLKVGKKADVIAIDVTEPNILPILDDPIRTLVPNLIFAATGREVVHSIIDGDFVMRDQKILTADEHAVREDVQAQGERVAALVAADPVHKDMKLLEAMEAGNL
ncbi:MAG: amidohydrolase family protein [Chloroflexota bacterium]